MASIFDVEEKQPIKREDLFRMGFHYVNYPWQNPETGKLVNNFVWELSGQAPMHHRSTWVVRYYERGASYRGQKLRSNRLVYKKFDAEKNNQERNAMIKLQKNSKLPMVRDSKRMPTGGYYTKKYLRNIGKADLDMVVALARKI